MPKPVRRIVTGHDKRGKAVVIIDGPSPHVRSRGPNVSTLLWVTDESPVDVSGSADRAARNIKVPPPKHGTVIRIVEFGPVTDEAVKKVDHAALLEDMGIAAFQAAGPARHAFTHRTRTIDYAIVLDGEIDMLLDDSEVRVKAGDVLIQQGTNHAWVNKGNAPCRICFVLIDAHEPTAWKTK